MPAPLISIIVPAFNEAESLPLLAQEIQEAMGESAWELLIVDDGSTDGTVTVIHALCKQNPRIRGFTLARHAGKGDALAVGMHHARGRMVVTMDADLQNDPKDIPLLLAALTGGADAALGWRQERADSLGKRWASALFNRTCTLAFGERLHDANTGFKALRRETLVYAPLHGGLYRFLPHILIHRGWHVVEVPVHHRPRRFGRTKYSFLHRLKGIPDLLTALIAAHAESDALLPHHTAIARPVAKQEAPSAMMRP
ncbi:MAG: glycosyltransferase family 2 protein [Candidatus Peribacteraceae bacterium]|nr:glycosyltransferase family 2 protein [Candidatus Peribacteraceae bacterium]